MTINDLPAIMGTVLLLPGSFGRHFHTVPYRWQWKERSGPGLF